jgi:hypothetical protein
MATRLRAAFVALGLVCLLAACDGDGTPTANGSAHWSSAPTTETPEASLSPTELLPPDVAQLELHALRVTERVSPHDLGYARAAFGDSWIDTDGNGCNQRDDVLLRDGLPGTVRAVEQGACDHDVVAGTWIDPYTGMRLTFDDLKDLAQAQAIQIDHVVPLAEAWVSGAAGWSEDRRKAFANDLRELLAVDGPTNESKSDGDPAAWRPGAPFQCDYARRWIGVKAVWDLAVDDSERRALGEMLTYCEP